MVIVTGARLTEYHSVTLVLIRLVDLPKVPLIPTDWLARMWGSIRESLYALRRRDDLFTFRARGTDTV
jgi:hypothetical protein